MRMLYDVLVIGKLHDQILPMPFAGQSTSSRKVKTLVWSREDARTLLDSIPKDSVSNLRIWRACKVGQQFLDLGAKLLFLFFRRFQDELRLLLDIPVSADLIIR